MALSIIILIILVFIFTILYFMKVKIELNAQISPASQCMNIQVKTLFSLIKMNKEFPLNKNDSSETDLHSWSNMGEAGNIKILYKKMRPLLRITCVFLKKVTIQRFDWKSEIGLDDAAASAVAAGFVWSLKGIVLTLIAHHFQIGQPPTIAVAPNFQRFAAKTEIRCMMVMRAGNTLKTGWKLYRTWKRINLPSTQ